MSRKVHLSQKIAAAALALAASTAPGWSTPITVDLAYHFLDNRGFNSVNLPVGVRQEWGAVLVLPNGASGTTGNSVQNAASIPLNFQPSSLNPNQFVVSRPADLVPNGSWTMTFTNGTDTTVVNTPNIAGASLIPLVTAMSVSGSGNAPTFTWTQPAANFDAQRIVIRDISQIIGNGGINNAGVANAIFTQDIGATATSFTVNPNDPNFLQPLQAGHQYSLEILVRDLRNDSGPNGLANTLSESRTFFDFTLLDANAPANVYLPSTNTTNPATPIFQFNGIPVVAAQPINIDPFVAAGYDYQTAAGDPNFASVTLPTGIGDNLYDLLLWDGAMFVPVATLTGGVEYFFGGEGVDLFRILGIETSAGLNPLDATAFVTALTFTDDGTFSGTMTPISVFVESVPVPATLPLFAAGLGVIGLIARRRRRAERAA
jgi:hypothetical protein